jgi:hypothetical protein
MCASCGSRTRLRYDRNTNRWACFDGCNEESTPRRRRRARKRERDALFNGYWRDEYGQRQRRVTRDELREAHRLWAVHADIREGPGGSGRST